METLAEEPRRVTPSEARAKLLRSLVNPLNEDERDKTDDVRLNFIVTLMDSDGANSDR